MRGIVIPSYGDSSVLTLKDDLPVPTPKPTEVLVKIEYAGVNFIDTYRRTGLYKSNLPITAGSEGAGTIESIGNAVDLSFGLSVGDKVAIVADGSFAEYTTVEAKTVLKLPEGLSTKEGAAIIIQGLTAWTLAKDAYEVKPGDWVLAQAAAGGTGGLLVQMCVHLGANVIGTTSTPEKEALARSHGCQHVINYTTHNLKDEVMKLTEGKGCHVVYSGVGQATFEEELACVRRKGSMVTYGNSSGPVEGIRALQLSKGNVRLMRPTLYNYIVEREEFVTRSEELLELIRSGKVKVIFGGEYPLEDVGKAQDDLVSKKTTGKLVIKIG